MTTQYAVFSGLPTGLTLTKKVFTVANPDTEVTGITGAVTERTNAKGEYVITITKSAVITGIHTIILFVGSTPIATGSRTFAGTDGETATTTPETAVLDPASRIKLDASQPDYAPAKAGDAMTLADNAIAAAKIASGAFNGKGDWSTFTQVSSMLVNTRVNLQVPVEIETPDAGTQVWKIRLFLFDEEGNMEAPDSMPTVTLVNAAGTSRAARLSVATNVSTGVYSWDYTSTAGDAEEQLVWTFTVVEGGLTRVYPADSYVVEETAYRFSSTDRATLNNAATASALATVATNASTAATQATQANTKAAAIQAKTDQLTFTTANKVDSTAVLDSAVRVKLDVSQPDYDLPTNTELATALAAADDAVLAAIAALNNLSSAQVNAELVDVLSVDTFGELSAPPAATSSLKDKITWLFMWAKNKATETSTQRRLYADNSTTVVSTETVSDDGTTFTKTKAS